MMSGGLAPAAQPVMPPRRESAGLRASKQDMRRMRSR
jgi:hypothetical protein